MYLQCYLMECKLWHAGVLTCTQQILNATVPVIPLLPLSDMISIHTSKVTVALNH